MKIRRGCRPPPGAESSIQSFPSTFAPMSRNASRWASRRRRPMVSPPGGGMLTWPKRASSGPATRNEARIRLASSSSTSVPTMFAAWSLTSLSSVHSTSTPSFSSNPTTDSTSRMRGTLRTTSSSSVSRQAARIGSAAFLLPAGTISPERGTPPWMMNLSTAPRVASPMAEVSREDAWQLVCEWIESDSLRKHLLGVEAAMGAYPRKWGDDEETYAVTGLVQDLDYERYPDLESGHPRYAIEELTKRGYPPEVIDAVAGHADFMGVPRETRLAKTLYGVDELSGFVAACAMVRPTGIEGMKPKSVKKKLKQPSFAAAVNRDEVQRGIEELGVDQDEHIALIIEALAERSDELGL